MIEVTLTVDRVPPSLNEALKKGGWRWYHQTKKTWGELLGAELRRANVPTLTHLYAMGRITFPNRIVRDQGNYRFMVEKALGDAAQAVGVLVDDNWDLYEFGDLTYRYEKDVRRTEVILQGEALEDAA